MRTGVIHRHRQKAGKSVLLMRHNLSCAQALTKWRGQAIDRYPDNGLR